MVSPDFHVRVLSPLKVWLNGRIIGPGPDATKANVLFTTLVFRANRIVGKPELIRALWDNPPTSANNLIEKYVSVWRKDLDIGRLETVGSGYRLNLNLSECDVFEAEHQLAAGREALARKDLAAAAVAFTRSLELWAYRLADLDTAVMPAQERHWLEELYLTTLEEWAFAVLSGGAVDRGVALKLGEALHHEPMRERLCELRMWALCREGRQAEALECYEQLRRVLDDALGQQPGPGLSAMHVRVLRQDASLLAPPPPAGEPTISNLPARNARFIGRTRELSTVHEYLCEPSDGSGCQAFAMWGLVGAGKSALALESAHRHIEDFECIWWIESSTTASIAAGLEMLAAQLGCDLPRDRTHGMERLWLELERHGRWLIVFDNASAPADFAAYWPQASNGRVLITSLNPDWRRLGRVMAVGVMSRDESIAMLSGLHRIEDERVTTELAAALGYLPLALGQAAAYMDQTGMKIWQYLRLFLRRRGQLLERGAPDDHTGTLSATWRLACAELSAALPASVELLALCSLIAPDNVPLQLLRETSYELTSELRAAVEDEVSLEDAIRLARRYSILMREDDSLSMHCLVQEVVSASLSDNERSEWRKRVCRILVAYAPRSVDSRTEWPRWEAIAPHVLAVASWCTAVDAGDTDVVALLRRTSTYLSTRASFGQALTLMQAALALAETGARAEGGIGSVLTELGIALEHAGRWRDALHAHQRAVDLLQVNAGRGDPAMARALSELGTVVTCHQGVSLWKPAELDDAERSMVEGLHVLRTGQGPVDPTVGRTMAALGQIRQDRGDLIGAQRLFEDALKIIEEAYGQEHPEFGRHIDKLAYLLWLRGENDRSRDLHTRAFLLLEAAYGEGSVEVGWPLSNLALVELSLGEFDQSIMTQRRARSIFAAADPGSPAVQIAAWRIAKVELARGRADRAVPLLRDALDNLSRLVDDDHPDVIAIAADLAAATEKWA